MSNDRFGVISCYPTVIDLLFRMHTSQCYIGSDVNLHSEIKAMGVERWPPDFESVSLGGSTGM